MKKKFLFFAILFTMLISWGYAKGESNFLASHYLYGGYFEEGLLLLTRLAPRDPLGNLILDLQPGISRTRSRSYFAAYATGPYRRLHGNYNRLGFFVNRGQVYFDRGLGSFLGLTPRDPFTNLLFDFRAGISRSIYRSFFASYGSYSYRRFPGYYHPTGFYAHRYRSSFDQNYYRYAYKQAYYNPTSRSYYSEQRLYYKTRFESKHFPYRYRSGVRSYGSGFSFRGRLR